MCRFVWNKLICIRYLTFNIIFAFALFNNVSSSDNRNGTYTYKNTEWNLSTQLYWIHKYILKYLGTIYVICYLYSLVLNFCIYVYNYIYEYCKIILCTRFFLENHFMLYGHGLGGHTCHCIKRLWWTEPFLGLTWLEGITSCHFTTPLTVYLCQIYKTKLWAKYK